MIKFKRFWHNIIILTKDDRLDLLIIPSYFNIMIRNNSNNSDNGNNNNNNNNNINNNKDK